MVGLEAHAIFATDEIGKDGVTVWHFFARNKMSTDDSEQAGTALLEYLSDSKWDVDITSSDDMTDSVPPHTIRVTVGLKPLPYFDPPQLREAKEKARQAIREMERRDRDLNQQFKQLPKPPE